MSDLRNDLMTAIYNNVGWQNGAWGSLGPASIADALLPVIERALAEQRKTLGEEAAVDALTDLAEKADLSVPDRRAAKLAAFLLQQAIDGGIVVITHGKDPS